MSKGHSGRVPEKPYSNTSVLTFKVTPALRRALREYAAKHDATVSAVIKAAVSQHLGVPA